LQADAEISGVFTALKTKLGLKGSRLDTPAVKLKDMDIALDIPSADIARIADAFAGAGAAKSSRALMDGALKASLLVNEQPVGADTRWIVREAGKSGLDVALESLDLRAGGNSVTGQLGAKMKDFTAVPAKDTVAALVGTVLPALNGRLSINVPDWAVLSALSGLSLSGQPLQAKIELENKGRQKLALDVALPSFALNSSGSKTELSGVALDVDASDLWGKPEAALSAVLKEIKADQAVITDTALTAEGGLKALKVALQSKGGVESVMNCAPQANFADLTAGEETVTNPKFELYQDKAGEYRFRLKARNGQIIAVSEGYTSRSGCENGIESVRKNAADATVEKE